MEPDGLAVIREYQNERFEMLNDRDLPDILSDARFERCHFLACSFGFAVHDPRNRRRISRVTLDKCKATNNTGVGPVLVEDCDTADLKTGGPVFAQGTVFRRVRFRGRCGQLMIRPPNPGEHEHAWREANERFYEDVDWAIDISEAQFLELCLIGVPADLVRRNSRTQVIVRRPNVERLQHVWRAPDFRSAPWGAPWAIALRDMLDWGIEDQVLVAPEGHKKDLPVWLEGLRRLQEAGVADP